MAGMGDLAIGLGANTVTLESDFARAERLTERMVGNINVAINKVGSGANFNGVSSQIEALKSQFASLQGAASAIFGVGLGAAGVRQLAGVADEYQGISNRIRTTTDDTSQMLAIQRQVFTIAQDTGAAYDDTAKMYQRLEQAIQGSGKSRADSQREAIALSKTLNQEIVVSGASAGEASRSIMDLVHGLSGGVLHAQQLRPIMRQMPDLAKQIADGLGLSAGKFEEMVHKGLPAEAVLKAIESQAGAIQMRFDALPKTFARTWQELENAVTQYVGQASQASVASDLVKNAISGIARNMDGVVTGAVSIAAAMGLWLGTKGISAIGGIALSLRDATLAQGEYKTAAVLAAESNLSAAAAQAQATAATVASNAAIVAKRDVQMSALAVQEQALREEIALAEARASTGAYSANVLAEEARLEASRTALAAVTAELIVLEDKQDAAQRRLALSSDADAAATARASAAKAELSAQTAIASSAMGVLGRGLGSVFTFIGGWPTVVLAAAYATYQWSTNTTDLTSSINALTQKAKEQEDQSISLADAVRGLMAGETARKQTLEEMAGAQRNVAQAEIDSLKAQRDQYLSMQEVTGSVGLSVVQWGLYALKVHSAESAVTAFDEAQAKVNFTAFTAKAAAAVETMQRIFGMAGGAPVAPPDLSKLEEKINKETEAMAKNVATFGQGKAAVVAWEREQAIAANTVGLTGAALDEQTRKIFALYDTNISLAQAEDALTKAKKAGIAAKKEGISLDKESARGLQELADTVNNLSGKTGGEYAKAWASYTAEITKLDEEYAKAIANGKNLAQAQALLGNGVAFAKAKLDGAVESIRDESDASQILSRVLVDANRQTNEQIRLSGLDSTARAIAVETIRLQNEAENALKDTMGPLTEEQQRQIEQLPQLAAKQVLFNEAMERAKTVAQEWQNTWIQAGNSVAETFAKVLVEGGSLLDGLKDIAKKVVESIIAQFVKLQVINPILNSIFGGQSGYTMLAAGGGGGGGLIGAGLSWLSGGSNTGGADFSSTAGGGTANSLFNGANWLSAGQKLYSGFQSGFSALGNGYSSLTGAYTYTNAVEGFGPSAEYANDFVGAPSSLAGPGPSAYGGYSSGFGQAVGIAGGVYAGYNRFQQSNGDAGGVAGAAAYGVGTYFAGAAASAALAGGLSAGLAAIPVVGWIALAAMLVDKFSGGKLFGTSGKPTGGWSEMGTTATGGTAQNFIDMKGQSAWFGGATFSQDHLAATAEQQKNADAFFDAMKKGSDDFAKQFGLDAGVVAAGVFSQKFDKKGNLTGETITHIGGLDYNNETQEQFANRIQAESFTADLAAIGLDVTTYTHQFIADADAYAAGVQAAASVAQAANTDIKNGVTFLATGADQSLNAIFKLAEGMTASGESIAQVFQAIEAAQIQYTQFTNQFKPAATFVDDFEAALSNINTQLLANIKQANDLAVAAGAEGAATKDLVNIHAFAAKQFAAAVQQLEISAQSNAYGLGLAPAGTLDQINNQIAMLEGHANAAANATGSFGDAMQAAAQSASDAINLLLGDLSPLNDQQKLQTALQGLYAGTVTQEQVLEIGRRLYATGQQYTDLFNTVTRVGSHAQQYAANNGGGGSNATSHAAYDPTGAGDHRSLQELYAARDEALAQQQYAGAQTLAQQIAEIAMAKGEDFEQVLAEMKIKDTDLAHALHLDNADQLKAYIEQRQAELDSAGENTNSIVNAIDRLGNRLLGLTTQPDADGRTRNGPSDPIRVDPRHNDTVIDSIERTNVAVRALVDRMQQSGIGGVTAPRGGLRLPAPVR